MNQVCQSKDKAVDMSQGTYLLLNSLFHIGSRFESQLKNVVMEMLQYINVKPLFVVP